MILAILRLIRFPNLLIVALTQYLVYYGLLLPAFRQSGIQPLLDGPHFTLLAWTTMFITAGGYIINDILDFRIDLANRPEKVVINREIRVQSAYWMYFGINLLGFLLAFYLALHVEQVALANLYPLAVFGLFAYSVYLKRRPLWGNLLVAAFCAGVAAIVWFAERAAFGELAEAAPDTALRVQRLISWYLAFAFLSTLFRELVKDLEDVQGDVGGNCRTLPVVVGMARAKLVAAFFGILLLALAGFFLFYGEDDFPVLVKAFMAATIMLPVAYALFRLIGAEHKQEFHLLSQMAKLVMLNGLIALLLMLLV